MTFWLTLQVLTLSLPTQQNFSVPPASPCFIFKQSDENCQTFFCDTDQDEQVEEFIDLPLSGDEDDDDDTPLMHIRAVRSTIRTPGEDDIYTLDSDSDSDSPTDHGTNTLHSFNFSSIWALSWHSKPIWRISAHHPGHFQNSYFSTKFHRQG